jgi:hypothetical protein
MKALIIATMLLLLSSCMRVPTDLMRPDQNSLKIRSSQSRSFEVSSDKVLLRSSVAVLQDMGYTIKESASDYGVLTATKEASAVSAGQVVGAIALAVLGGTSMPIDKTQYITVTMVILDKAAPNQAAARTTFQRIVRRSDNTTYSYPISDPKVYQEFYEKLDKALFLEVNKL